MADYPIKSIGLFIDGGYYMHINEALAPLQRLHLKNLIYYIRKCIAQHYGLAVGDCVVTECHFFQGRFKTPVAKEYKQLESDRLFEDQLIDNDVVFHYKHMQLVPSDIDPTKKVIREKGIDVWFALETLELAQFRDFDFVALITGDSDHEMLARKIKALKKPVILVTWPLNDKTQFGKNLTDEVSYHINLAEIIKNAPDEIKAFTQ